MTYHRLAYDDAATTTEMVSDARAVGRALQVPDQGTATDVTDVGSPTPSVVVSDELAEMAAGLSLHFD